MSTPLVRAWYALAVAFAACLIVAIASVAYSTYAQRQNDRRWCALLSDLDAAYSTPPGPSTELGRKVATEIHKLRVGLDCPDRVG